MRRVRAEVLNARKVGAYHSITLVAPEVAERVRPGETVRHAKQGDGAARNDALGHGRPTRLVGVVAAGLARLEC